jgi:hypothetical protein
MLGWVMMASAKCWGLLTGKVLETGKEKAKEGEMAKERVSATGKAKAS